MASIGQKLETKGVIMTLLSLVLISTGCEDKIDSSVVNPSEGKTMEVTLNIGIADEEDGTGASASPTSKAVAATAVRPLRSYLSLMYRLNLVRIFPINSTTWKSGSIMKVETRLAVKHWGMSLSVLLLLPA